MNSDDLTKALSDWKFATGNLPWGVQSLTYDTLVLAANEKVSLVFNKDVHQGTPCLFNAIRNMTTQLGSSPSEYARDVVAAFDTVNTLLRGLDVNKEDYKVSPIAAEILVHNFGQRKIQTEEDKQRYAMELASFAANCTPYIEPTDEEVMADWLLTISKGVTNEDSTRSTSV